MRLGLAAMLCHVYELRRETRLDCHAVSLYELSHETRLGCHAVSRVRAET